MLICVRVLFVQLSSSSNYKNDHPLLQEGDIHWTIDRMTLISCVSVAAGILASLLGIGGGMILSPLMLSLGVLPEVTSATSTFMIVRSQVEFLLTRSRW